MLLPSDLDEHFVQVCVNLVGHAIYDACTARLQLEHRRALQKAHLTTQIQAILARVAGSLVRCTLYDKLVVVRTVCRTKYWLPRRTEHEFSRLVRRARGMLTCKGIQG
jgi:hypothetical protein